MSATRPALDPRETSGPAAARSDISGSRVLVCDEHYKHSLAIVRHLGLCHAKVAMVASSPDALACRSKFCCKVIPAPAATVSEIVKVVLASVKSEHFDVVIPVSYPTTLALAREAHQIRRFSRLELADSHVIELAANKAKMARLAETLRVPVPKTTTLCETNNHNDLSFPLVIKAEKESPGRAPVRYAQNRDELTRIFAAEHPGGAVSKGETFLVQEFIPGVGCGFFATYQQGVCKRVFMHRRVREYPASGGVSSCAESFYDAKLEIYGRRLLDALEWHGVAMVEFRQDARDGEYKLMEVNPKFWGSLDLALAAGADFPGDLCRMALGDTLPSTDVYTRGLRFQWPFSGHGELFHLWTRPSSFFEVGRDFLNPRVQSNIWISDFAPNAYELRQLLRKLIQRRKR